MAGIESTITIKNSQYRPCFVDGRKALFHKFEGVRFAPPKSFCDVDKDIVIGRDLAIVEYEDGKVDEVSVTKLRFADRLFQQYVFCEDSGSDAP